MARRNAWLRLRQMGIQEMSITHSVAARGKRGMCKYAVWVFLFLLPLEYAAFAFYIPARPTSDARFDTHLPGGPNANVIGQRLPWQLGYGVITIGTLYLTKTFVVYRCSSDSIATMLFLLVIAFCIPVLWVFVTTDWNNPHAELAYWFNLPVGLLAVPIVGFFVDLRLRPYRSIWSYVLKSIVEIPLILIWHVVWVVIELFLGFYWI